MYGGLALFGHGHKQVKNIFLEPDPDYPELSGALAWDGTGDNLIGPSLLKNAGLHQHYGLLISFFCYADLQPWGSLTAAWGSYYGATGSLWSPLGPRGIGFS